MTFLGTLLLAVIGAAPDTMESGMFKAMENTPRQIVIDVGKQTGKMSQAFKRCVGAGRANEGLRADWQRQLRRAKKACGFEYVRMHGLLTDDMGVYHEERGKPVYSWQYIDELYDFLVDLKVRPFVELGFMPWGLSSGSKTIFWWRGNVTPPRDYDKWADLIEALVRHWVERYGLNEVKKWYFEVWNEPNLDAFWDGTQQEYYKLYDYTSRAVKRVSKDLRVGGPATAGNAWVAETIAHCLESGSPIDFISTHTYGVDVGYLDEFGGRGTALSKSPDSIVGDVRRAKAQILASKMPRLELHYTEWSSSYTPADAVHDSYVSAAYILEKLHGSIDLADSMSYWTFTDIFEEAGPRATPFHGGFGLMNYQDIEKPSFRAYEYLNKLGPTRLACEDKSAFATKDAKGGVQVLFWNFSNTLPENTNNQDYFIKDIKPKSLGDAKLTVKGLAPGKYKVAVYQVGYRINDPYAVYYDMGRPRQLTKDQVAKIRAASTGKAVFERTVDVRRDGSFDKAFPMRENDVYLVTLTRV